MEPAVSSQNGYEDAPASAGPRMPAEARTHSTDPYSGENDILSEETDDDEVFDEDDVYFSPERSRPAKSTVDQTKPDVFRYAYFEQKANQLASGSLLSSSIELPFSRTGLPIEWNKEFQQLLELPEDTKEHRLVKYEKISYLNRDFVSMAKRFGKIIISEAQLPSQYRTINPMHSIGGRAGGIKYIYNGILFKLQTDYMGIYGGDFYAMKTGGLELKGLMRYYGIRGLHVPLMAVIDYRGYRLVAESILPINSTTIVYGSADGGKTLYSGEQFHQLKDIMAQAAKQLNIAGHFCGKPSNTAFLHAPIDIEVHLGSDQRFYVIDFARVFPPTAEDDTVGKTFLYKVMRPEFVRRYKEPLSSDAFSGFTKGMVDEEEHNLKCFLATDHLLISVIPRFAEWLEQNYLVTNLEAPLTILTELIHREGINCRYLGLVRQHVESDYLKEMILNEMIARVLKNQLNEELRETMHKHATIAEHSFTQVVLEFFNRVLGWDDKSQTFWRVSLRADIEDYFGVGVIDDIVEDVTPLRSGINMWLLMKRVQQLSGVKLTEQAMSELKKNPSNFYLVSPDIRKMAVRVKHMNIISLAEANALALQAMDHLEEVLTQVQGAPTFHHDRLFSLAMAKFEQAIQSTPDNTEMLNQYATVLEKLALLKAGAGHPSHELFERACGRYTVARQWEGLMHLGEILCNLTPRWDEREKIAALANKCYAEVCTSDPLNASAWRRWGDVLVRFASAIGNLKWISLAGAKYRKSIELNPLLDYQWIASWHHRMSDEELATCVQLLHMNQQQSFLSTASTQPQFITDNLVALVATNLRSSVRFVALDACAHLSEESIILLATNCSNIELFNLRGCGNITDKTIGHVANLPHLRQLDMSHCTRLTSLAFKYVVTKSTNLTHFNASFCDFQPHFILAMNNFCTSWLRALDLSGLRIPPESWCRSISKMNLNELEEISLDCCTDITDSCIGLLAPKAPNLRSVSLAECTALTDTAVFSLAQSCTKLEKLNIRQCVNLSNQSLSYLGTFLSSLQVLNARNSSKLFSETKAVTLFAHSNGGVLSELHCDNTLLDDETLACLSTYCSKLKVASLGFTKITSRGVESLVKSNPNLEDITLSDCHIDDHGLMLLATACGPSLKAIRLSGCHDLSDLSVELLGSLCVNLELLDLSQCSLLTDSSLRSVVSSATRVKTLKINECRKLTDATLESVGTHLHALQILHAERCVLLARVAPLALGCPELRELRLRSSENIGDDGIEHLSRLKMLRVLDIYGCRHVADSLLIALHDEASCPALEELILGGNKMIDGAVQLLKEKRPRIQITGAIYPSPALSGSSESRRGASLSSSGSSDAVSISPMSKSLKRSSDTGKLPVSPSPVRHSQTATRALMHDLRDISKNPLPFVSARPLEDNLLVWHCNLTAPAGSPYAGAVFHIQLTFPETYPSLPPSGTMLTPLPHPHVHKDRICLDLLSDFQGYFASSGRTLSEGITGWSSAYSVQTILLQLQTFLMDLRPEDGGPPLHQYLSQIPQASKAANSFKCSQCGHSASNPWPPLGSLSLTNAAPISELDIIKDELKCFHTRVPFDQDVLGIGVSVVLHKNGQVAQIHSPLDLLSYTAFTDDGVRESVYMDNMDKKHIFTHWLPLWLNNDHGERAKYLLRSSLSLICTNSPDKFEPQMALIVLPKLMNELIVDMMAHRIHASIKALEGYCAIHRLMIYFVREYPQLLDSANRVVSNFAASPQHRTKAHVPSLGDLLATLSITTLQWKDISHAYIEENFVRNVRWVLDKYPELADPTVDANRSLKTFWATTVSIRLMMFHVYFLANIGRPAGKTLDDIATGYDQLYGRPNNAMKDEFLQAVRSIMKIQTWEEIFSWVGLQCPSPPELCEWFQRSVRDSLRNGYHQSGAPRWPTNAPPSTASKKHAPSSKPLVAQPNSVSTLPSSTSSRVARNPTQSPHCKFWRDSGGKHCPKGQECRFLHHSPDAPSRGPHTAAWRRAK